MSCLRRSSNAGCVSCASKNSQAAHGAALGLQTKKGGTAKPVKGQQYRLLYAQTELLAGLVLEVTTEAKAHGRQNLIGEFAIAT